MDKLELIQQAIDANAFTSIGTSAGYINPTVWNRDVLRAVESSLVVTQSGKVYNDLLNAPGSTLNITVGVEPTWSSSIVETTLGTVDAITYTQVVFTPTEYLKAYQLSDKEARRSFFDLMADITQKLGYALARKRENAAVALLQASAGNAIVANGVVASAIASTDALDYIDIVNAMTEIEVDKCSATGGFLFVHPRQKGSLMKDSAFYQSYVYGGREVILNGEIGTIAGLRVLVSDEIPVSSSAAKALVVGKNRDGTPAWGTAVKSLPKIETQRNALGRWTDIVAVEEWDQRVLYANAICTINSYCA